MLLPVAAKAGLARATKLQQRQFKFKGETETFNATDMNYIGVGMMHAHYAAKFGFAPITVEKMVEMYNKYHPRQGTKYDREQIKRAAPWARKGSEYYRFMRQQQSQN